MQSLGLDVREVFLLMSGYFFDSAEYQFRNRDNTQYVTDRFATFFNRTPDGGGLSFSGATARCRSTSRHGARWSFRPLYELWSWTNALNNGQYARRSAHDVPELARVSVTHKPRCAGRLLTLRSNRIAHRERFAAKKIVARGQ